MTDPLATQPKQPAAPPVDNAKMMADYKIKLMHMKRALLGLKQELRNRMELWEAALDEIETLEGMASEAKANYKNKRDEIRGEKKAGGKKSKDEDKKDEKPEDGFEDKKTPDDDKKENVEKNDNEKKL